MQTKWNISLRGRIWCQLCYHSTDCVNWEGPSFLTLLLPPKVHQSPWTLPESGKDSRDNLLGVTKRSCIFWCVPKHKGCKYGCILAEMSNHLRSEGGQTPKDSLHMHPKTLRDQASKEVNLFSSFLWTSSSSSKKNIIFDAQKQTGRYSHMLHRMVVKSLWTFLWSNLTHSAGISTRPCWGLKPNFSSHLDISRSLRTRSKLLHIIFNWHQLEMFPPKSPPWNGCQNVVWLIHFLQACPVLGETMLTKPFDIFGSLGGISSSIDRLFNCQLGPKLGKHLSSTGFTDKMGAGV